MATLTVDAEWDAILVILPDPNYITDTTGTILVGTDAGPIALRGLWRFNLSELPAGQTVTLAQFLAPRVWQVSGGEDRMQHLGPYDTDGQADPEVDNNSVAQATKSSIAATKYLTTDVFQAEGNDDIDITAGAAAHIAAAAGGTYSLVLMQTDETTDATKQIKMFGVDEAPLTPPDRFAQLYIEYEPEGGGGEEPASSPTSADGNRWIWR